MEKNAIDIYFDENYGKLYEQIENGKSTVYKYSDENGSVSSMFLLREIPTLYNGTQYYDIITPYGYGGPVITELKGDKAKLVEGYAEDFKKYCQKNNIVSEFIRFHPVVNNAQDFEQVYHPKFMRKTLGTRLDIYDDPVAEEFSRSSRKNIRQVLKNGINYKINVSPDDISKFKEIYYSTMDRNGAADYYYFDDKYFSDVLKYFKSNVITVEAVLEEKTIAMGLYFVYNGVIHIHLSGTLNEYLHFSPAYILRYGATLWGKENGYRLIHHGGGRSNSEDDPLYLFKRRFAEKTDFDFYVAGKVWNEDVYSALCDACGADKTSDFFPAYRSR